MVRSHPPLLSLIYDATIMIKNIVSWGVILLFVILLSLVIIFIDKYSLPSTNVSDGLVAVISAFVGILVTMTVTAILLNKQSEVESSKERNVIQFTKKQETYYTFLQQLESIITSLTERNMKGNDKTSYENIVTLEHLLFQFGYMRIHMNDQMFEQIIDYVAEIFKTYRSINLYNLYQKEIVIDKKYSSEMINNQLYALMQIVSKNLFIISGILNNDMYGYNNNPVPNKGIESKMQQLLNNCGLKEKPNTEEQCNIQN